MAHKGWIAAVVLGATLSACSSQPAQPPETVTVTTERPVVAAPTPAITTPSAIAPATSGAPANTVSQSWTMPNLIGSNLQDAQDAIQALTNNEVFFSGSTDLTGQGRNQIMDANWQVCTSTPPPGATITKGTMIDFGVVRIDIEDCP
nr:hypothetical protein CPGR_04156 [Mycolicibacterium malmesburyense]